MKTLQGLVAKMLLEKVGQKRVAFYRLPAALVDATMVGSTYQQAGLHPIMATNPPLNGANSRSSYCRLFCSGLLFVLRG